MKERFLNYVHHFRGLAIVLIVGVHCRTSLVWPEDSVIHSLLIYSLDSSTILFVFISGFLFQYLHSETLDYATYLTKKIKYVIVPYILVSIPAILDKLLFETDAYWMGDFYQNSPVPVKVLYMLLTGKHSGPFYYIPVISIIFMSSFLLFRIQRTRYFTLITLAAVSIGLFTYAYGYYATLTESLLYFLPVYVLGMWVSKHREYVLSISNYIFFTLILTYLFIFYLEMSGIVMVEHLHFFESVPHYLTSHFNWGKLKELILAITLLILFYRWRNKDFNLLTRLGSYSFGIYFIHIYFINVLEHAMDYFRISRFQHGPGYFVFTAAILSLSFLTVYAVKKVFGKNSRILIGS